jgi:hypothetical protein
MSLSEPLDNLCVCCNQPRDRASQLNNFERCENPDENWLARFCYDCHADIIQRDHVYTGRKLFVQDLDHRRNELARIIAPFTGNPTSRFDKHPLHHLTANQNYHLSQQAREAIEALKLINYFAQSVLTHWHETPIETASRLAHRI